MIAGAVGLHRNTPVGLALAMVAALLGAALGAITFLAQVVNDEPDRRLTLWTLVTALSLGAAWIVHAATPAAERHKGLWNRLPILKSVVSAGIALSLAQFWYTSIYIPTTAPASLSFESDLTERHMGDRVAVEGTITIKNTSGTRVSVVASVLNVSAARIKDAADPSDLDFEAQIAAAHRRGLGVANLQPESAGRRYATTDGILTIARGPLLEESSFFEPNEVVKVPFVAWLPAKERYDVAIASVELAMARSLALALEDADARPARAINRTVWTHEIPEAGWLRRVTRDDRYLRVAYNSDPLDRPGPDVTFATAPRGPADPRFNRRMWRFYGVNAANSSAFVALTPASEQP